MTIKNVEDSFLSWLAGTRTGSMFKIGVGAVLAYVLETYTQWDLPPILAMLVVVMVPVVINELNPSDGRYGRRRE